MSRSRIARICRLCPVDIGGRQLDGFSEPDDAGDILGPCPAPALLAAAVDQVVDLHAFPDVEGADTLGAIELVGGEGEEVDVLGLHVDRHVADDLDGIGVEGHLVLPCNRTQFRDRLDRADLVVGVHDGDQDRLVRDRLFEFRRVDEAVLVDREIGDGEAFLLQVLAGMEDRMVLDLRSDDMVALLPVRKGHSLDRPVVGLASPGGEIDLIRSAPSAFATCARAVSIAFFDARAML